MEISTRGTKPTKSDEVQEVLIPPKKYLNYVKNVNSNI